MNKILKLKFFAILVILLTAIPAFALDLDSAKSQNLVGETNTGYLAVATSNPSNEVKSLVKNINSKRKELYAEIARKNGTSVSAVEILAAKKAIDKTPSGQLIKQGGQWVRK
jgi:hypothetical protein